MLVSKTRWNHSNAPNGLYPAAGVLMDAVACGRTPFVQRVIESGSALVSKAGRQPQ